MVQSCEAEGYTLTFVGELGPPVGQRHQAEVILHSEYDDTEFQGFLKLCGDESGSRIWTLPQKFTKGSSGKRVHAGGG